MNVLDKEVSIKDSIICFDIEIRNTYNCPIILFPIHSIGNWINPKHSCIYTFGFFLKSEAEKSNFIPQKFCWNFPESIYYEIGPLNKLTMDDLVIIQPMEEKVFKIKINTSCINLYEGKYDAHFELCQTIENLSNIILYKSLGLELEKYNAFFYSKLIRSNNFILKVY